MNDIHDQEWIAPKNVRLPDFIICGAMKCGTSTVHQLLNKHPRVFIPASEVNFFDIDDLFQHSDFFFQEAGSWYWPSIIDSPQEYWNWYESFFKDSPENCIIGEHSTSYLPSAKASYRISLQSKPIKAIICLRQPTLRAYSQYWHMLRTGRALFDFENTIKFTPHYVLERSMYLNQVREFIKYIPRGRVFFFVLEEFLADKERVMKNLLEFLSLNSDELPKNALNNHSNAVTIPKSIELQIFKNRILRSFGNKHYTGKLPFSTGTIDNRSSVFALLVNKFHNFVNPSRPRPVPELNSSTRIFLDQYFKRELQGISDIVGVDLDHLWFKDAS